MPRTPGPESPKGDFGLMLPANSFAGWSGGPDPKKEGPEAGSDVIGFPSHHFRLPAPFYPVYWLQGVFAVEHAIQEDRVGKGYLAV
jgi:hypothetical protein